MKTSSRPAFGASFAKAFGHFDAQLDADIDGGDAPLDLAILFHLDEPVDQRLHRFVGLRQRPESIGPVIGLGVEDRVGGRRVDHGIFILVGDRRRGDVPRGAPWRQHHLDFVVENEFLGELGRFVDVETAIVINDLDRHLLVVFRQHQAAGVVDPLRPEVILGDCRRFRAVDEKAGHADRRTEADFRRRLGRRVKLPRQAHRTDSGGASFDKRASIHSSSPPLFVHTHRRKARP